VLAAALALALAASPGPAVAIEAIDASAAPSAPCAGEVCAPRVAVPGFEPRFCARGKRAEQVLGFLGRREGPIASAARAVSASGLRLDWTPPQLAGATARRGFGELLLVLRFRLDAANARVRAD
jgi:hypothetical protein